jgi:aspartyl-tRNA synthetase
MHRYRTHNCSQLNLAHVGQQVRLSGWLRNRRDHTGVVFIDLTDHYGTTQLVVAAGSQSYDLLRSLSKESVICVDGLVTARDPRTVNRAIATGDIEVEVTGAELLGPAAPLPFSVFPDMPTPEEQRLAYRFLDLRRPKPHANMLLRSHVIASIRRRMQELGFVEYQTPTLTASSPEGARDYLVPSRRHPGKFYALPQAPQMFKQLIMVSGFDRYFQIAPCYRDEDSRSDRSPGEFYQLDLEMSFVTQEDVFQVIETLFTGVFSEFCPQIKITPSPFPRIPYEEALLRYGSDKPDLRNPLEIVDVTDMFENSSFRALAHKQVRAIRVPQCFGQPRSFFERVEKEAKASGAAGVAWLITDLEGGLKGSIAKFLASSESSELLNRVKAEAGDGVAILGDENNETASRLTGVVRDALGRVLGLIEEGAYRFCWIVNFPMYERDAETGKIIFSHNPFSMPQGGLKALNEMDPLQIKAFQYDIVCNGHELSSGAIRNHELSIMCRAFEIAGYKRSEVEEQFRALFKAFQYGAPPHGGIAPGVDRIVMLLADEPNIREIIMFPMNQNGQDLLMNAPNAVPPERLRELHLRVELPADSEDLVSSEERQQFSLSSAV